MKSGQILSPKQALQRNKFSVRFPCLLSYEILKTAINAAQFSADLCLKGLTNVQTSFLKSHYM